MKKLISVLSALFPVFSVGSTIVACNNSDKKADDTPTDVKNEKNETFIELSRELFEEQLGQVGVDGSLLNSNSTIADALVIITEKVKELNVNVKEVKLVDVNDLEKNLKIGDSIFTISFDFNGANEEFQVVLKNVKDANYLNNKELEIYINDILDDPSSLTINDSHADQITTWTNVIGKKIHEKAHDATIHITTANDSDPNKRTVTIEIDNLPNGMTKITKVLKYLEHSKPLTESHLSETIIKDILTVGINANHLNEHSNWKTALAVLQAEADKIDRKIEVNLQNPDDIKKNLTAGTNLINVVLKTAGKNSTPFKAKLKDVQKWSLLNLAKKYYDNDLFINESYSIKTFGDFISENQKFINTSFKTNEIKLSLKNNTDNFRKVQLGFNLIEVVLTEKSETRNFTVRLHNISKHAVKVQSNPNSFPKISKYLINGIDSINDLGFLFTVANSFGQAMYEIGTFLQSKDPEIAVYASLSMKPMDHHKLQLGNNVIKFDIYKGKEISEFSITLKNVTNYYYY